MGEGWTDELGNVCNRLTEFISDSVCSIKPGW